MSAYFDYSPLIRKMIYTTNTIESYHRNIRKMTKTKAAFTSDNALSKLAFLAIQNMEKNRLSMEIYFIRVTDYFWR